MRRLFSTFAHGAPGIGLLLLRLASGCALIYQGITPLIRHAPFAPVSVQVSFLGILLLVGLWTPIAGTLVVVTAIWEMALHSMSRNELVWIAIIATALVLLGPGAWSIDARLYGWKKIKISDRRAPDQGSRK
jgi:putative oxidoreductase